MIDLGIENSSAVAAARRRSRTWEVLVRLGLVLGGVALALAICEGAVRLFVPEIRSLRLAGAQFAESDVPGIPYLYRPNMKERTNSLGLLNPTEVSPLPAAGTFRILVVGDSVTSIVMDELPNSERLYTTLLEKELKRRAARPVEVLNLSAPGLSLRQELALIEARGLALRPHLIIVAYCWNDPVETDIGPYANVVTSRILFEAASRLSRYQDDNRDPAVWYDGRSEVYQRLESSFASLSALARDHHVVVAGFPVLIDDRAGQPHLSTLETLTARNAIPYIDLYADLQRNRLSSFRGSVDDDPLHFNRAGHEAIAQALSERLLPLVLAGPG
jgi:lysophospholipase L1-like esterase